jgi:hypothetical protein
MTVRACCPPLLLIYMLTYVLFVCGWSKCSRCDPSYDAQVCTWKRVRQTFRFCVLVRDIAESATAEESSNGIHVICHRWMWCCYQSCASCLQEVIGSSPSRDTTCLGWRLRVFPISGSKIPGWCLKWSLHCFHPRLFQWLQSLFILPTDAIKSCWQSLDKGEYRRIFGCC